MPITGVLGDQQAATVGQVCFSRRGQNTYGTGNFLVLNTGTELVRSQHGLLTTVAYQFAGSPAVYALEGSIAVTGAAVQWLRDQLKIITSAPESERLALSVEDNGGMYFVRPSPVCSPRTGAPTPAAPWSAWPGTTPGTHRAGHAGSHLLPEP
ncbi:FGGY-family carbohydrate kinase [Streptomyces sp. INA 01156]